MRGKTRSMRALSARVQASLAIAVAVALAGMVVMPAAAGASTPASASVTSFTAGAATASTGAFSVPVGQIPADAFKNGDTGTPSVVQSIGLGKIGLGKIGLGKIGLGKIGLGKIGLGKIGLGKIGLGKIGLVSAAMDRVLISDVPITYPRGCADPDSTVDCTGWKGVLAGTGLEFAPLQNVTMKDVLLDDTARARFESLELVDLDLSRTPLANIPFAALALANIPVSKLPLDSTVAGATPVAQWCTIIEATTTGVTCADLGLDPANPQPGDADVTPLTLALAGVPFDQLPLDRIQLLGLPADDLAGSPLGSTGLGKIDLSASGLGKIGLGKIGLGKIGLGKIGLGKIGLGKIGLGKIGLGKIGDLQAAGLGKIGLGKIGLGKIGLGKIGLGKIALGDSAGANGVGSVGLGKIDLTASGLGAVALSDLTNRDAIVVCADPNAATPVGFDCSDLTGKTLGDVATAGAIQPTATLYDLFQSVDPNSASGTALAAITVADIFGNLLTTADPNAVTLSDLIAALAAAGNLSLIDANGAFGTTIADLVDNSTDAQGIDLATLLAGLSAEQSNGTTLAELIDALTGTDLADANAVLLADLLSVIANDLGISLEDLLLGLLGTTDLPWHQLDLSRTDLQDKASPQATPITYTATLVVTGDAGQDVTLTAVVPDGFLYQAGSTSGLAGIGDPTITDGTDSDGNTIHILTWTLSGVAPGTYPITFAVWAGLSEGASTASAEAHLTGDAAGAWQTATVDVRDNASSGSVDTPVAATADTLYLGHITPQKPSNYYRFSVSGAMRASINLGNLPNDYDLILYDLSGGNQLRGAATKQLIPVSDPPPGLATIQDSLPAETLQDLPYGSSARVYDVRASRGTQDEVLDTGTLAPGQYLIQVAGYNGASSSLPYSLRIRLTPDEAATCPADSTSTAARFPYAGDAVPDLSTLPGPSGTVDTLVLVNPTRMTKTYGAAAMDPMVTQLGRFLATYGKAQVVRLDDPTDPEGIGAKYDAWDADPCSVTAANDVVRAIGQRLDALESTLTGIKFVVIAGADDTIPMARMQDATRVANEQGRAFDYPGQRNQTVASMAGGNYLSDDVFAARTPIGVGGRDLFVPEIQVGRLVETPGQVAGALQLFADRSGVLPSSSSARVLGYDFLSDGSQKIADNLSVNGRNVGSTINDTWTRDTVAQQILGADAAGGASNLANPVPDIASINAHFDESNLLPAVGNAAKDESSLFSVQDAEAAGTRDVDTFGNPIPTLQGRLLFSMGCHSGLNLPGALFGANAASSDWADFMARQGALWIGNTGFGYGDTETVSLTEDLMAKFAGNLDRAGTIGEALAAAKQQYAADKSVISPYDEKALQESTFYGLPMWTLPTPKLAPAALPAPGVSSPSTDIGNATVRVRSTGAVGIADGGTAGGAGKFHLVTSDATQPAGHYEIDGNTQTAPRRPIQPRYEMDVTPKVASDPALAGYEAKGALITSLTSKDIAGFLPDYYNTTVDDSANETATPVGDAAFPAGIQAVSNYGGGAVQRLVVVPGQFRPTPGLAQPGRGTQRLFTGFAAQVYYAPAGTADNVPPTFVTANATVSGNTVTVTARVRDAGTNSGGVRRVFALVTQQGTAAGQWFPVQLTPTTSATDPADMWSGTYTTLPQANLPVDAYYQAVDAAGNVAAAASKGAYFNAQNLASQGPHRFSFTNGVQGANGWWRGAVTVNMSLPIASTRTIQYSVDGGPFVTTTPFGPTSVRLTTDGVHTVTARTSGYGDSTVQVLIDSTAPVPGIGNPNNAALSSYGWYRTNPLSVSVVPLDPNEFGSGVDRITYSASGANTIAQKTVDQPAVGQPPVTESLGNDGITTFAVKGTDRAGNIGIQGDFPVGVDHVAPTVTASSSTDPNAEGWHKVIPTVTITASDDGPSSGIVEVLYRLNGDETLSSFPDNAVPVSATSTTPATTQDVTVSGLAEGRNTLEMWALDAAGNVGPKETVAINVDLGDPTSNASVSPAEANGWERVNTTITFSATDPNLADGANGSGVRSIAFSAAPDATKGGLTLANTVRTSTDRPATASYSTTYQLTQEGITTFTWAATDAAGRTQASQTRVVRLDKTLPSVSCPAASTQWFAANQTYTCTASDQMSGLDDPAQATMQLSTSVAAGTETATAQTDSQDVYDVAGNMRTAGPITGNKIDRKAPVISLTLPPTTSSSPVGPAPLDPATGLPVPIYILGQTAKVAYSCTDGGSGVKTCQGLDGTTAKATNAQLDTATVGEKTFTVNSTDNVLNPSTVTYRYRVVYQITPQYDITKPFGIGNTAPLKVILTNAQGQNVGASTISLTAVSVDNNNALLTPNASGNSSPNYLWQFDSKTKTYQYNLKTDSRFNKAPTYNWMSFKVSTDPATTSGSATDMTYLNKLYRTYFLLK